MTQLSDSQLERIRARLLPFGVEWTRRTKQQLTTVRDGLDFLTSMKDREDFWAALGPQGPEEASAIDFGTLRALLPSNGVDDVDAYLRSVGLTEDEIHAVVGDLDEPARLQGAIQSAFAESKPQSVARALERILDTNSDILATQRYVGRLTTGGGVAKAISAMMGIALFLLGAACAPAETTQPPQAQPPATTTTAAEANTDPEPTRTETDTPDEAPPADPTPAPDPVTQVPATDDDPVRRQPNPPPDPAPLYKGVSPRRA